MKKNETKRNLSVLPFHRSIDAMSSKNALVTSPKTAFTKDVDGVGENERIQGRKQPKDAKNVLRGPSSLCREGRQDVCRRHSLGTGLAQENFEGIWSMLGAEA